MFLDNFFRSWNRDLKIYNNSSKITLGIFLLFTFSSFQIAISTDNMIRKFFFVYNFLNAYNSPKVHRLEH